jgi:hypothetical protein
MPADLRMTAALVGPIPYKYGKEKRIFLSSGIETPKMRGIV